MCFVNDMVEYDKEFLDYMKDKYHITLDEATNGTEMQRIRFAVAWDIWKHAKKVFATKNKQ